MNSKKRYEKISQVGEGTFGVVFKAKDFFTNRIVAMKKIRLHGDEEGIPSSAIREISILKQLKHVNIVELVDVICTMKKLTLVFEFVDKDLTKIIKSKEGKGLNIEDIKVSLYLILGIFVPIIKRS